MGADRGTSSLKLVVSIKVYICDIIHDVRQAQSADLAS
jgi:hypothetical protein